VFLTNAYLDVAPTNRYKELGVKFFGRRTCPHCVSALEVLESRGLSEMLDVETDAAAGTMSFEAVFDM